MLNDRHNATDLLTRPSHEWLEGVSDKRKLEVLVQAVKHQEAHAPEVPPAVHKQQALEEAKLSKRKVGRIGRLRSFDALDPHSHRRLHDHLDVICTITNRQGSKLVHVALEQRHHALSITPPIQISARAARIPPSLDAPFCVMVSNDSTRRHHILGTRRTPASDRVGPLPPP